MSVQAFLLPHLRGAKHSLARLAGDRRLHAFLAQALLVLIVGSAILYFVVNTAANIERAGTASGFGFLNQPAGYDIALHLVEYDAYHTHARVLLIGTLNTLLVSFLGMLACTALGVALGVLRMSGNWLIARLVMVYVELIRNVPLLLQIFFWYAITLNLPNVHESWRLGEAVFINRRGISVPTLTFEPAFVFVLIAAGLAIAGMGALGAWARRRQAATGRAPRLWPAMLALIVGLPVIAFLLAGAPVEVALPELGRFNVTGGFFLPQAFTALFIALSTYTAAFVAEIVRGGIQAVSKGQREAAAALGLRPGLTMRLVVLPQALRVIVPPLTNQYLNLFKNSSLGVAIGYPELFATFGGTTLNQTGQAVEVLFIVGLFYLLVSLFVSLLMNLYNRAVALKGGA